MMKKVLILMLVLSFGFSTISFAEVSVKMQEKIMQIYQNPTKDITHPSVKYIMYYSIAILPEAEMKEYDYIFYKIIGRGINIDQNGEKYSFFVAKKSGYKDALKICFYADSDVIYTILGKINSWKNPDSDDFHFNGNDNAFFTGKGWGSKQKAKKGGYFLYNEKKNKRLNVVGYSVY